MQLAKKLEIESILGVEKLVIEPGALTIIEGRNASGKTSILEAARAILRGGHDPSLVRHGAEEGRIRLTLADGTVFLKRVTKERSTLEVTEPQKGRISRAQAYVDSQVDELGIDPMAIVTCPASKRAEYLAEVMPIKVEPDVFEAIIGRRPTAHELSGNALDLLAGERQRLYDERTAVNRTLKDKRTTAAQLRETLPAAAEVPADPAILRAKKTQLERDLAEELDAARGDRAGAADVIKQTLIEANDEDAEKEEAEVTKIRNEMEGRIEALRVLGRKRASEREESARDAQAKAYEAEQTSAAAARSKYDAPITDVAEKITKAEALEKEHHRASKTREIIAASEKEAARAETASKALSHAIDELDALKASLLEKLPIKGLEIREGQVLVDGIPFERLNRARQIEVALKIAQLRAGNIGLIVVDDTEHLDSESFAAFEAAAAGAGLQFLAARVSDGDLSVRTVEAPAAS
jgi:DNA repair exonuclease SbcCD ATPase subunit